MTTYLVTTTHEELSHNYALLVTRFEIVRSSHDTETYEVDTNDPVSVEQLFDTDRAVLSYRDI